MSEPNPPPTVSRFIGLILVAVGTLWLVLTGLCTAVFAVGVAGEGNLNDIGGVLSIGVPSALIGIAIYAIGRALRPR